MTEEQTQPAVAIDIRRGMPTDEELAAVVAVVAEAYRSEIAALVASDDPRASAWMTSRRNLRQPLRRELGWSRSRR